MTPAMIDGGAGHTPQRSEIVGLATESLRSIFPRAEALGLVEWRDVDLDTLAERVCDEAVAAGAFPAPPIVSAFAPSPD
jgi:hypothetical protein